MLQKKPLPYFIPCFRTYQKELITKDGLSNVSMDLVTTHLAIFERSLELGGRTYFKDYVASCFTFKSNERVPAGVNYSVKALLLKAKIWQVVKKNLCFSLACM